MIRLVALAIFGVAAYAATISGIVVDADGRPLAGVHLDHGPPGKLVTGPDGSFRNARVPIIFRKSGYESMFVADGSPLEFRITLHERAPQAIRMCAPHKCPQFSLFGGTFCLSAPPDVRITEVRRLQDQVREFVWGAGFFTHYLVLDAQRNYVYPFEKYIARSVQYSEVQFEANKVLDARGKTARGNYWRRLGSANEAILYIDVSEQAARVFDRVFDTMCLVTRP